MTRRDLLLLLVICLAWAGNFLMAKLSLHELPPLLFTGLRLALLAVLLAAFTKRPTPGHWPRLLAVALCNGVLHFGLSFWALSLSATLASPAIVLQSYVPMATLLAWWLLGERFHWRTATAIGLSFAGVLVLGFDPSVLAEPAALLMMLLSAFFLGLGTVLLRKPIGVDPISLQGWTACIGCVPLLLASLWLEPDMRSSISQASALAWAGVAYAAVVASLLGHSLYFLLLQRHPVAQVTPYLLATPVLAALLGIIFLDDVVGPRLWLGGTMVLGGVLLIALRHLAKTRPAPVASEL